LPHSDTWRSVAKTHVAARFIVRDHAWKWWQQGGAGLSKYGEKTVGTSRGFKEQYCFDLWK